MQSSGKMKRHRFTFRLGESLFLFIAKSAREMGKYTTELLVFIVKEWAKTRGWKDE